MRANAIGRVIEKLNAMQRTAQAVEALEALPSEELPAELPGLPEDAAGAVPFRPDIIPAARPELSDLPDVAMDAVAGRPDHVPTSRPELLPAAVEFCPETGLPMVAMADDHDGGEPEHDEAELVM